MSDIGDNSSVIRECLYESSGESDFDIGGNEDELLDFSSGSGEDYIPDYDELDTSDQDNVRDIEEEDDLTTPATSRQVPQLAAASKTRKSLPLWIRVYPPEPDFDSETLFEVRTPGPKNLPPKDSRPIEYFNLFFTNIIWSMLVRETNAYAEKNIRTMTGMGSLGPSSRLHKWINVTLSEMKKYIALVINMGIIRKKNVEDYWDTDPTQYIHFFPNTMARNRFQCISAMIHLTSKTRVARGEEGYDPWYKVRAFFDNLNETFKRYFNPYHNLSIDESMIGMKNRCVFIQYLPNKRHARFGIKKFELCDSKTSYVCHVEMYSGSDFLADGNDPFTMKVIMDMMEKCNLLDKGYHVYCDNFYTKLPLCKKLIERGTFLTGTVNKNTKDLSPTVMKAAYEEGEITYFRHEKVLLVGYRQNKRRKPVFLITSGCHAENKTITSKSGLKAIKPVVIDRYNKNMGGVDVSDKSVYHVSCTRTTRRYWKKIFYNLMDLALLNAYILYEKNTSRPMERKKFLVSIVSDLAVTPAPAPVPPPLPGLPGPGGDIPHQLAHLPGRRERLCVVCDPNTRRRRSNYWCPACNCGVHPTCYHKLEHFFRPTKRGGKSRRIAEDSDSDNGAQ